jgi:hypothetical protein
LGPKAHWIGALLAALIGSVLTSVAWTLWIVPVRRDPPVPQAPRHEARLLEPLRTRLEGATMLEEAPQAQLVDHERRLGALEEQIASLLAQHAQQAQQDRRELDPPTTDEASLRKLVAAIVAEDRARRIEEAREGEETRRREELQLQAGVQAAAAAAELSLQPWERDVLAEVLVQLEERRAEIDRAFAEGAKTPEEHVAEIQALETWMREELARLLGPQRAEQIAGS